ncbi:cutinase, partial [Auriculariales sp. MPI-PUGE-AT-0066]
APLDASGSISSRQLGRSANDVTNGVCRETTLLFARGTSEGGNLGTVVGPPLSSGLQSALGADKVAVQGIDYPASITGAIQGSIAPQNGAGAVDCAKKIAQVLAACPDTSIVLAGYSQGAQQVHGCLLRLNASQAASVQAAVTFGDPLQKQAFNKIDASQAKVFCNAGDAVCNNQFIITAAHLSYGRTSVGDAVDFIQSQL